MNLNQFTEKSQEALQAAQSLAQRRGHQSLEPEHLLAALLEQPNGLAGSILAEAGGNVPSLRQGLDRELDRLPQVSGSSGEVYLSPRLRKELDKAEQEAKSLKDDFVSIEHLLLALLDDSAAVGKLFKAAGLTRDRFMTALQKVRGHQRVTSQNPEGTYQSLEKYGRDLTKLAGSGKLDPVIGRDEEIRRVIQVLSRRTKNNRR
jgi:ATP-dependent Clp protease ATP-binding subunit ClpB